MKGSHLQIVIHPDRKIAPRYDPKKSSELGLDRFVVTVAGTVHGKPIVDIVMKDDKGHEYFTMLTGALLETAVTAMKAAVEHDQELHRGH